MEIDGVLAGVALWQPPGTRPNPAVVAGSVFGAVAADGRSSVLTIGRLGRAMWSSRPALVRLVRMRNRAVRTIGSRPSWYLAVLGTDERFRRRGVARELLERVLDRCDEDGVPVWTETSDEVNVRIYERFGFMVLADARGGGAIPDLWVLHREPGAAARSRSGVSSRSAPA